MSGALNTSEGGARRLMMYVAGLQQADHHAGVEVDQSHTLRSLSSWPAS